MKSEIDADSLYAELLMLRTVDHRVFLLLEGPGDEAALSAHIDRQEVEILLTHGSRNMDQLVELVDSQIISKVVAVRDRDFLTDQSAISQSPNVVLTDFYDMDATILLGTSVLDRLVNSYAEPELVKSSLAEAGIETVDQVLVGIAVEVGALRFCSVRDGHGLKLREFPVHAVIQETLTADREIMVRISISRSKCQLPSDDLCGQVAGVLDEKPIPVERLCSGHDLLEALVYLIRGTWGTFSHPTRSVLAGMYSAFSCGDLYSLNMHKDMRSWEKRTGNIVWACR